MQNELLVKYLLQLADNAMVIGHRNSEWCGHGPVLEQDIAMTNIALDHLGQARNFFQYAAILQGNGATEDSLAYLRLEREYKNCLLTEQPNGDWAQTILRQFFFSAYQSPLYQQLMNSRDEQIAAISNKSLKEVTYHLRWSSEWVIRLGDGTPESHQRIANAIEALWPYTGELFMPSDEELAMQKENIGADLTSIKTVWENNVKEVFDEAGLAVPAQGYAQQGGKKGLHTEHMGYILAELQYMQRAYPDSQW